ncbi:hypothetical protein AB0I22_35280 [Streptomyces sp. NPDC050610]|uniref:hypothetical protein n=1 Tax=Streptomyces sp. NPDC050610 TaxID=3157097 RepID=UPI0034172813
MTATPDVHADPKVPTRQGYWCECVAYFLEAGNPYVAHLGGHATPSPWTAVMWLAQRAGHIADQLDHPSARPVRAWLEDGREHAHAVARLGRREPYAFVICTGQLRFTLSASPTAIDRYA